MGRENHDRHSSLRNQGKAPGPCREWDNRWTSGNLPAGTFSGVRNSSTEIPMGMLQFPGGLKLGTTLCFTTACGHFPSHREAYAYNGTNCIWCLPDSWKMRLHVNTAAMPASSISAALTSLLFISPGQLCFRHTRPHLPQMKVVLFCSSKECEWVLTERDWIPSVSFKVGTKRIPALLTTNASLSFSHLFSFFLLSCSPVFLSLNRTPVITHSFLTLLPCERPGGGDS